ncbi:MAG: T9SS type A sorting domain-containing protein, partial [Saprospiraceae bacterium]
ISSIEAGGAGMLIWDFSALANHEESTFTFENAANTPYGSFFPTANLAVEQDTLGWLYFALDNQSLRIVGTYAHVQYDTLELEVGFTLSPEQSIIRFPATYGDEYTELIKRSLQIPGSLIGFPVDSVKIVTTVNHHVNIDAYGPVTTPNNTYECLRSTETDISIDSTFIKFAGVWQFAEGSQPDTAINYNWWTNQNGLGFPVVNIDLQAANGTRTATWLKEFVTPAAEILPAPTSLRAYPNPTSGQLSVELQSATKGSLSLYGVNGKELLSKPIGQQVETLDVSGLPAGHYILILKNSTGRTTGSQQVEIAR